MKMVKNLKAIIPPVIFSLGVFMMVELHAVVTEDIAPYPYAEREEIDLLKQIKDQKKFYLNRIKRSPDSGLDLAALANTYVIESGHTGDLSLMDKAEETAKKSLEALPFYNEGARLTLAQVAESRHQFQEAISIANSVYASDQNNKSAVFTLVSSHLGYGQIDQAMTYANRLVELAPESESYTMRALVYLAQGKNEEAIADFKESINKEAPDGRLQSAWTRTLIGRYYFRAENFEMAESYTDSALAILPDYHLALAQKGDIEFNKENYESAHELYTKAYKERQEPPYLLAHAKLHDFRDEPAKASTLRSEAEGAVRNEIQNTPYGHYNELAQILIEGKDPEDFEEAIAAAQKNVEQRPTSEAHFLLAQALAQAGRVEEARISLKMALSSGETNFEYNRLSQEIGE